MATTGVGDVTVGAGGEFSGIVVNTTNDCGSALVAPFKVNGVATGIACDPI